MKGINSYGLVDKDNVEDIIGFIRKNYNSFNCPSYTFKRLTNNKINYNLKEVVLLLLIIKKILII